MTHSNSETDRESHPHSDPEMLVMMALGESATPDDGHLGTCEFCQRELASLRHVADLARGGIPEGPLYTPSESVWSRISGELGLDPGLRPATAIVAEKGTATALEAPGPDATGADAAGRAAIGPGATGRDAIGPDAIGPAAIGPTGAARRSRAGEVRRRRRSSRPASLVPALAAAAVIAIAGAGIGTAIGFSIASSRPLAGSPTASPSTSAPETLAVATLDALPDWPGATGDAIIERRADGTRDLEVSVSPDGAASGIREVWLISADLSRLISVGVLDGARGTFPIPESIDLTDFSVVDVSAEKIDGDPAHSGDSIVRGSLGS